MTQFQPPSQPGWSQPEPNQQPFPPQHPMYTPPAQPQQYEQWQQQPPSQPLPMQSTGYYPWPPQQADVPPQQQPQYPQQPSYTQPGQYQQPQFFQQVQQPPQQQQWHQLPVTPIPPQMPFSQPPFRPKRKMKKWWIVLVIGIAIVVIAISVAAQGNSTPSSSSNSTTPVAQTTSASDQSTPVNQPTSFPTSIPTTAPTPQPTVSAADVEALYKAITTNTTVTALDKDGNADSGKDVHFTAAILNFAKDGSGNTAGANLDDPNGASGVVQIAFPANTDLSQLNVGDIVEVWGNDGGTVSGQNAYGATIQEVVLSANYLTDKTTGYQTH